MDSLRKNIKKIVMSVCIIVALIAGGSYLNLDKFMEGKPIMVLELEARNLERLNNLDETLSTIHNVLNDLPPPPVGELVDEVKIQQYNFKGTDSYIVLADPYLKIPVEELQAFHNGDYSYRLYKDGGYYYLSSKDSI